MILITISIFLLINPIINQDKLTSNEIIENLNSLLIPNDIIIECSLTITKNINGVKNEKKREIIIFQKFYKNNELNFKSLINFTKPKYISGTSILFWDSKDSLKSYGSVYIPALNKFKKINLNNNQTFDGIEFNFFEFYKLLNSKKYLMINDDFIDNNKYFKLKAQNKQLSKEYQILWVEKNKINLKKVEFFDHHKQLTKLMKIIEFTEVNSHQIITKFVINDFVKKNEITFEVFDFKINTGLNDSIFKKN